MRGTERREVVKVWVCVYSAAGKDHSEWVHHKRLSGGLDPARQEPGNGAGCGGGANSREGGASGSRGLLLWQPLYKVLTLVTQD